MKAHLDSIDGLRGIAIALVVAYHSWLVYGLSAGVLSETGFMGVELFFSLSGFCIFYPFARAHFSGKPLPSWASYAYRRAAKILPSYLVALTVFAIMYLHRDGTGRTVAEYFAHVFFIHPFVAGAFQSISGPLWTIGIEVQFYLIFPLLCGIFLRRPLIGALLVEAVAGGYRGLLLVTHSDPGFFLSNQIIAFLDLFAAGMLAGYAVAWVQSRPPHKAVQPVATAIAIAGIAGATVGMIAFTRSAAMSDPGAFFVWQMQWRIAIAAILFAIVASTTLAWPGLRRVVANPVSTFLAVISYNLYLWHLEVLSFAQREQLPYVLGLLGALVIAGLVTYAVERPLLAWRARPQTVQTA